MRIVDLKPEDLLSLMPMVRIIECTDDDGDGAIDGAAWDEVVGGVNDFLVELLGGAEAVRDRMPRYSAKVFAVRALYVRRGSTGKDNPAEALAAAQEKALTESVGGGTVIQSPSVFHSDAGRVVS